MEKIITAHEAQLQILKVIDHFMEVYAQSDRPCKLTAQIHNVGMFDILELYLRVNAKNIRLYMPKDLDTDCFTVIYKPVENCIIEIESEPIFKVRARIPKGFKLN